MNNIRQKNVIFGLRSNATQPYIRHDYVNQGLDCVELNANTVNNGFQQLLDNDLYAERRLQDLSVHMDGPKAYDENTIDSMPDGFKAYGDIKNSPCFDILHKVEFPIEQTVTKSAALLGGYGFVCEYGNTVFVGGNGKNAAYSEDVAGDSWHRLNDKDGNAVVANGFCRYGERLFFAADDGVYEMSSWVDYETSDADDYGKTRYALVRLNGEPLALNAVSYDSEGRRFMACLKDGGLAFGGFDMKKSVSRQDVVFREFLQYDGDETVTLHGRDVATFGNRDGVFGIVTADEGVAELQISAMYDIERSIPVGTSANRCREMQKFDGYTFVASDQGLYCIETSDFIISQPIARICVTGNNMYVFCSGSPAAVYVVSEGLAVSGNVLTRQFNSGDAMLTSMTVTSGCVFNGRVFVGTTSGVYYFEISDVIIVKRLHAGSVIDVRSSYDRVSVAEQHALYIYKTNGDTTSTDTDMVKDLTQRPVASGSRVVRLLELDGVRYVVTNSAVYVETDTAKCGEYPGVAKDACAVTAPDGTKLVLICGTFGVRAYSAEDCSFVKTIIAGSEFEKLAVSDRTVAATCTDNTILYVNASTLNAAGSVYTAKTVAAPESGYNISSFVCNNGKSFNGIGLNGSNAHLYTYAENSELNPAGIPGMDSVTTIAATHNLRGYVYSGIKGGAQGVYVAMYEDVTDSDIEESVSAVYKTLAVGGKSGIVDNNNPLSADIVHYIASTGQVEAIDLALSASVSDRGADGFPLLASDAPHTMLTGATVNQLALGEYLGSKAKFAATNSGIYVSPDTAESTKFAVGTCKTAAAYRVSDDETKPLVQNFKIIYGNASGVYQRLADNSGTAETIYSSWSGSDTKIYSHRNDFVIAGGLSAYWYNPASDVNGVAATGCVQISSLSSDGVTVIWTPITNIVGYAQTQFGDDIISYYIGKHKIYLKNADIEGGDEDEYEYKPDYGVQKQYDLPSSIGEIRGATISEVDGNGTAAFVLVTTNGIYKMNLNIFDGSVQKTRDNYLNTATTLVQASSSFSNAYFTDGVLCIRSSSDKKITVYNIDSWTPAREIESTECMVAGNSTCWNNAYYLKNNILYRIYANEDVAVTQYAFPVGTTITGIYMDGEFSNYGVGDGWVNETFNVYRPYSKISGSSAAKSVAAWGNFIVFVDTSGKAKYMKRSGMSYSSPVLIPGQDAAGFAGCYIKSQEESGAELILYTANRIYSVYLDEDTTEISLADVIADEDYTAASPSLIGIYMQEPVENLEFIEQRPLDASDEWQIEPVTIGQLMHNDDYDGYYMFSATNMYTQSDNPTIMLSKNDDVTGQKLKLVIGENGHLISAGGSGVYDMTARQTLIASAVSDIVYAGKGMYFIKQGSVWNYVIGGMFGSVIPCTPLSGKGDVGSANFTDRTLTLAASGNLYAAEFVVDISLVMYGNAVTNLPEAQLLRIQESTGNSVRVIAERSGKQREYQFDLTLNDGLKLVTYDRGGEKHTDFDFIRYSGDSANSYVYASMQPGALLYGRSGKLMTTTPTDMAVGVNGVFQADGLEYWMYSDKNCIVVSHGYNQTATVAMLDPASVTQSKRIIEASSGKYVIQSDYGIQAFDDYTLYTVKENSGIRGLNSYNIDGTTKFVYVDGHDVYTSRNCKLWSKQFSLSARYSTVYDVKPLDLRTWLFLADTGTYYTKYDYQVVHDINSFTQEQALTLYDELMSRRNTGISAQVSSALSNHISSEHSATSLVTQMNNDFLDTGMDGVLDWQRASGDSTDMDVMNDVVAEMTFGTSADGDLAVQARNFTINNEVSAVDLDFSYIMKRWMSGVTELYISIPTTHTYYLANVYGAGNCMVDSQTKYVRKNLSQFGTAVSEQDGDLTTHYTDIVIGVTSAEYHIDNMLDMQVNGNSLPLQIYKDTTQGGSNSLASQLYRSFVEPSVMKGMQIDRTDEDGNYTFNAACFGSDAQAVRLMFYDSRARQNLPWVRIVFDPNGGEGSMSKQKFLINEDGTLERKPLKKCRFTNTSAGYMKIFAGWTLTPQADNYSWDSGTYTGGQIYEENQTFPYSQTVGAMMTELMRSSDEDFVRKEEITLYAVWLTYQFTAADTTLTLNSDQTRFAIDSVGVDTSTKLKNNVVINYGG